MVMLWLTNLFTIEFYKKNIGKWPFLCKIVPLKYGSIRTWRQVMSCHGDRFCRVEALKVLNVFFLLPFKLSRNKMSSKRPKCLQSLLSILKIEEVLFSLVPLVQADMLDFILLQYSPTFCFCFSKYWYSMQFMDISESYQTCQRTSFKYTVYSDEHSSMSYKVF